MSKKTEVPTIFPPFLGFLSAMEEADELTVEEKTKQYVESSRSKESTRKAGYWVKRLEEHSKKTKWRRIHYQPQQNLNNNVICSFWMELKKADSTDYETNTIHYMFSILMLKNTLVFTKVFTEKLAFAIFASCDLIQNIFIALNAIRLLLLSFDCRCR